MQNFVKEATTLPACRSYSLRNPGISWCSAMAKRNRPRLFILVMILDIFFHSQRNNLTN